MTPTQERDLAKIAIAKNIVSQLNALEQSLAEARTQGIEFRFSHNVYGHHPSLSSIIIFSPSGKTVNITDKVLK